MELKPPVIVSREEVESLLDMPAVLRTVEDAFAASGRGTVQMPPKMYLNFSKYNGDLRIMPTYMEELDIAGTKIVNVHPNNSQKGLPTVMATILLNDPQTGALIAIMDGTYITNMRTGAAGGVAAKYLARKNSKIVGLIGAGAQGETQLLALKYGFKIETIKVFDQNQAKAKELAARLAKQWGIEILPVASIQETVAADIVCTTTPSREPIVRKEWIKPGTHINAIGADAAGKEELDPAILQSAKIVIDNWAQASHSGEINVPFSKGLIKQSDIYAELGEIVVGKKAGRISEGEITVFDSTGLAIQDISVAKYVYDHWNGGGRI